MHKKTREKKTKTKNIPRETTQEGDEMGSRRDERWFGGEINIITIVVS